MERLQMSAHGLRLRKRSSLMFGLPRALRIGIRPMDLKQGQLWWANLPEPVGWRPVLLLTRSDALKQLQWVTVALLTRTIRNIRSEALLETNDGVPQRCAVTLDNIATVEQ